jgi:DNA-binding NarL/FixJ family response regulator
MSILLSQPNSKITVFLADDSPIVRERLITILDELSEIDMVGQAANVAESIGAILLIKPDVVILDMHMPGGSGLDVLQAVKQVDSAPVVIVLTNYPYAVYRQKCLQAGADFFLDKSTEFDQIPALFERIKRGFESGMALEE